MLGYIEMHHAAAFVGQHDEDIEDTKSGGGDGKEINGDKVGEVIIEKCSPRL
jgi:hypothetical protein